MGPEVRIRWHLELVGDVSKPLLRQDRQIRTSLEATDKMQRKLAKSATDTGQAQTRSSRMAAGALAGESRARRTARSDVERLNRAQAEAIGIGGRLSASARRVADSYRQQAAGARQAATAQDRARAASERAARSAQRTAATVRSGAGRAAAGLAGAAAGGGAVAGGIIAFAGFEQQMDRVQAVSSSTGKQLARMTAQAKQLGRDTSFSAREAAAGMYQLATAGFDAREVMRTIPGTLSLAAASGTDLASAAELQAATLRGFGLAAGEAARVADVLTTTVNRSAVEMFDLQDSLKYIAPVARATGQSMESMLAAIGLMGNVGVKGSQAGTSLRTALVRLTAPTEKSATALRSLGIEAEELRGPKGLLPLPEIMRKIADGAGKVDKGTRNAALAAIFGREALSGMIALVDQGPAALDRNIKALQDSEGQAKRTATIMRSNVAGAWDTFTGSLETAAITLTTRFGPALQTGLKGAANFTTRAATGLGNFVTGLATGRDTVRGQVPDDRHAGRMRDVEKQASSAQRAGATIRRAFTTIANAARSAGDAILTALEPARPFLENVLLPALEGVGRGITVSLTVAATVALPVLHSLATVLGAIGDALGPLRPLIGIAATLIGVRFAGAALTAAANVSKLGGAFRLLGAPLRAVGGLVTLATKGLMTAGKGMALRMFAPFAPAASRAAAAMLAALSLRLGTAAAGGGAIGRLLAKAAPGAGTGMGSKLAGFAGKAIRGFGWGALAFTVVDAFAPNLKKGIGDQFAEAFGDQPTKLEQAVNEIKWRSLGTSIAKGVTAGIDATMAAYWDQPIPGPNGWQPRRGAPGSRPGRQEPLRRGGIAGYAEGGLVTAALSPGELVRHGGMEWTVPGTPTAADNVLAQLPMGAQVFTWDGQARLAAGQSPAQALAMQLPHFRAGGRLDPGQMASLAWRVGKVRPENSAIRMGAYGMRESRGIPTAHNYDPPRDDSWGLWQINVLPQANPKYKKWNLANPNVNATAMGELHRAAGEAPWGGYPESSIAPYLAAAARGFRKDGSNLGGIRGITTSDKTLKLPLSYAASRTRGGLLDDAFGTAMAAGRAGAGIGAWRSLDQLREAIAAVTTTRDVTIPGRGRRDRTAGGRGNLRSGGGWGGTENIVKGAIRGYTPTSTKRPHDTVDGPAMSDHYVGSRLAYAADLPPGDGVFNTVKRRLRIPAVMGGGPADKTSGAYKRHRIPGLSNYGAQLLWRVYNHDPAMNPHVHLGVQRMRRGGIAGYRPGGRVGGLQAIDAPHLARAVGANRKGSLEAFILTVQDSVSGVLERLRRTILSQVRRAGDAKTITRLQGALSAIDTVLGNRVGSILRTVDAASSRTERGRGLSESIQAIMGISADSVGGAQMERARINAELRTANANRRRLERARDAAVRAGQGGRARELTTELATVGDAVVSLVAAKTEQARTIIKAKAQEKLDASQFGLDLATGAIAAVDAGQRLAAVGFGGTGQARAGTPEALRARAAAITANTVPALQAQDAALRAQFGAAWRTGDADGVRSAALALQQNANDLAHAVAEAGELLRDASLQAAQGVVDIATHGTSLANSGLANLELNQRIAGTYEGGGAERAAFITKQIIPALQAELKALGDQEAAQRNAGDLEALRLTIEAEAAKRNEILQATLDATEQVADNTDPREFGGLTGFSWGGETLTDALVTIGNGT